MRFSKTAAILSSSSMAADVSSAKDLAVNDAVASNLRGGSVVAPVEAVPHNLQVDEPLVPRNLQTVSDEDLSTEDRSVLINFFTALIDFLDYLGVFDDAAA